MKNWLNGRPIDSDFWLLRAAGSVITLLSLFILLIAVIAVLLAMASFFGESFKLTATGLANWVQFLLLAVAGTAFGQLCHALADIASGLGRLNQSKSK